MGQQQLLLLVLSTVIVGLATVAGIQAFDEGQSQATQDALTQRALSIGNDIYAATQKPSQLGGVDINSNSTDAAYAAAAGLGSDATVPAEGAGSNANCDISADGSGTVTVTCQTYESSDQSTTEQTVVATVDTDGATITSINGNSNVGS